MTYEAMAGVFAGGLVTMKFLDKLISKRNGNGKYVTEKVCDAHHETVKTSIDNLDKTVDKLDKKAEKIETKIDTLLMRG